MHPLLRDLEGAATLIRSTRATTRRRAVAGEIPGSLVGHQWRFWAPAVLASLFGEQAITMGPQLPDDHTEPDVIGLAELSDLLGMHPRTVGALLRDGQIPGQKLGIQWRIYWPQIRDKIAAGEPFGSSTTDG